MCSPGRKIAGADSPDAYVRQMVLNEYLSWRRRWAVRTVQAVGERVVELADARGASRDHAEAVVDADDVWNRLATPSGTCTSWAAEPSLV